MSDSSRGRSARLATLGIIVAVVAASIAYRVLVLHRLEHTSLLFIGIPAIIAFALLEVEPKTAIGTINKVIAFLLCLSGVFFGEGLVCILFAAPIFFLVGTLVGVLVNWGRGRWGDTPPSGRWRAAVAVALLPMSAEGVVPHFERGRQERVTVAQTVEGSPADVRAAIATTPRFDRPLPPFFRLGFPVPARVSGSGLAIGDRRAIEWRHGQHHPGTLVMAVASSDSSSVAFAAESDDSYITHWLDWKRAVVRWRAIDAGRTRVEWTLEYRRRLDPAWYFAPLERYGARLAAGYLIETLARPRASIALPVEP